MQSLNLKLSTKDFFRLSKLIHSECGIKMPESKKTMLEARLGKRMRNLSILSFTEYCNFLFSPQGWNEELVQMIDAVTTNKTDFFRESEHFDFLIEEVLPERMNKYGKRIGRPFRIWSAGCSSGEEPYTMAMVLAAFAEKNPGFQFSILATDISTKVLEKAIQGIYEYQKVDPVPLEFKKKFLLKSVNRKKRLIQIVPGLRNLVEFRRLNLTEKEYGLRYNMDIIFCRNVIIYFDKPTQEALLNRFCKVLSPGGYLFLGHSETMNGLDVPLERVRATIYKKPA